jgi:hypothetical protein
MKDLNTGSPGRSDKLAMRRTDIPEGSPPHVVAGNFVVLKPSGGYHTYLLV